MLKLSGLNFCVIPIKSIVRKGEMPELPDRVKEKAVLDIALRIRLMVLICLSQTLARGLDAKRGAS